jgi:hypothetical protein
MRSHDHRELTAWPTNRTRGRLEARARKKRIAQSQLPSLPLPRLDAENSRAKVQNVCGNSTVGSRRSAQGMPGGLFQVVGETDWQLSHGERSRVYLARALLQGADLAGVKSQ